MTRQEAYDTAAQRILSQGRAGASKGGCWLRYQGLACAVGALIPDAAYDAKLEGFGVEYIRTHLLPELPLGLLLDLQSAHDKSWSASHNSAVPIAHFFREWGTRMRTVAATHLLSADAVSPAIIEARIAELTGAAQ